MRRMLGEEMLDSGPGLPLTGGTLTGAVKFADGTVALPSISFASDPDTGFYKTTVGELAVAVDGVIRFRFDGPNAINYGTSALRSSYNQAGAIYASGTTTATIQCDGNTAAAITAPTGGITCLGTTGFDAATATALHIGKVTATSVVVTPALTPSGGLVSALTAPTNATLTEYAVGSPPASLTQGTDTAFANGTSWFVPVYIPVNRTVTGIGYLIGSIGGTTKVITALYTTSGQAAAIVNSALAGTVVGTLATFQEVPFTAPTAVKTGWYWALIQSDSVTARFRLGLAVGTRGGTVAGTFGTLPLTITLPTTNVGAPYMYVY